MIPCLKKDCLTSVEAVCTGEAVHWSPTGTTVAPIAFHLPSRAWYHTEVCIPHWECAQEGAYDHTSVLAVSERKNKHQHAYTHRK